MSYWLLITKLHPHQADHHFVPGLRLDNQMSSLETLEQVLKYQHVTLWLWKCSSELWSAWQGDICVPVDLTPAGITRFTCLNKTPRCRRPVRCIKSNQRVSSSRSASKSPSSRLSHWALLHWNTSISPFHVWFTAGPFCLPFNSATWPNDKHCGCW